MNIDSTESPDETTPAGIDFSGATRGKFFSKGAQLNIPLYLDAPIAAYLSERALAKGVGYAHMVNELLRKDIELIEAVR